MAEFFVEMHGASLPLNSVDIPDIREKLDRIRDHLDARLARLDDSADPLSVVFVVETDGSTEMVLRGSPEIVNEARDMIGEQDEIYTQ